MNTGIVDLIWRNDQRLGTLIITYHRGTAPRRQIQQTFINGETIRQKTITILDQYQQESQPMDVLNNQWHVVEQANQANKMEDHHQPLQAGSSERDLFDGYQVELEAEHLAMNDPRHDMSKSDFEK
jgi:hypothetical protein